MKLTTSLLIATLACGAGDAAVLGAAVLGAAFGVAVLALDDELFAGG